MENKTFRINSLRLQNFRCFADNRFKFHPEFNLMIGINGAGKTALLEALAVSIGCWLLEIRDVETRHIRPEDIRRIPIELGKQTTFEDQFPVHVVTDGYVDGLLLQWDRTLKSRAGRTSGDAKGIAARSSVADFHIRNGYPHLLPVVAYYGAGRLWQDLRTVERKTDDFDETSDTRDLSRFSGYWASVDPRTSPRLLTRWMGQQAQIEFAEQTKTGLYRLVCLAMVSMMPDAIEVQFSPRYKQIQVRFSDGSIRLFTNLSDGQRNTLALAGDIAMRIARLNPQLEESALIETPGVVLIDELDLHLHPQWQREIVVRLRKTFPKVQFIATTHSPLILSEVEPECVTILENEGHGIMAFKPAQSYGLDAVGVLGSLMHTRSRAEDVQLLIDATDDALEEGNLDRARELVESLRVRMNGDDPESARLEASINSLEALADYETH